MKYTEQEIEIIECNAATMTVYELVKLLPGREAINLQQYLHRHNIKYKRKVPEHNQKLKLTYLQERFIDENYSKMNVMSMAKALGVGFGTVRKYTIRMDYKPSRTYRKRKQREVVNDRPANKPKEVEQPRRFWPAEYSNTNWETYLIND